MTISMEGECRYRIVASPGWWISFYLTDVDYKKDDIEEFYADIDLEETPFAIKVTNEVSKFPNLPKRHRCILQNCLTGLFEYIGNQPEFVEQVIVISNESMEELIKIGNKYKTKEWRYFVKAISPLIK